jgi:hypothetical protein
MNIALTETQALTLGTLVENDVRRHVEFPRIRLEDINGLVVKRDDRGYIREARYFSKFVRAHSARCTESYLAEVNVVWDLNANRLRLIEGTYRLETPLDAAFIHHVRGLVEAAADTVPV